MSSPYGAFRLSSFLVDEDAVVLVPAMEALKMRAQGGEYVQVEPGRALWLFNALESRRRTDLRYFVAETRLSSFPLYRVDDEDLIALVRACIRDGRLVGMRKDPKASKQVPSATTQQRLLVRKIETSTRGRLSYAGRQYKLVVDVDLGSVPNRGGYEVASHDEAKRVLDSLAKESGTPGDLAALLGEASARLTLDWRPPRDPDGLVLLRRNIERAAAPKDNGPAISPSQMKAMIEAANRAKGPLWVRIEMAPRIAEQENAKFRLMSSDNSIAMTKTVKDDMEPGNETIDLLFEDLWKDLSYSLQVEERGSVAMTLFENVPYADLVSLSGPSEDDVADAEYEVAGVVDAVRAIGLLDLEEEAKA